MADAVRVDARPAAGRVDHPGAGRAHRRDPGSLDAPEDVAGGEIGGGAMGKAEKYPLSDVSLHGCPVKCCSMRLFMAALP